MAAATLTNTSEAFIAAYVQKYIPEHLKKNTPGYITEITETCHQQCIKAFEKIQNAVREMEQRPHLSERRICVQSLILMKSSGLIDAIQAMFFEMYGLKIPMELDRAKPSAVLENEPKSDFDSFLPTSLLCEDGKLHSYKSEFVWSEADLEKIFPQKPKSSLSNALLSASKQTYLKDNIKLQEQYPAYRRQKLLPIGEASANPPVKLNKPPREIEFFANRATFYSFNAEGVQDEGWGCAWRSIQTCLSSYDIRISFRDLFHLFGPKFNLQTIYRDKYSNETLNSTKPFAPYELSEGWAEPFIGEMAMHYYGIPASLERINGSPKNCNAPVSVFHNPPLTFSRIKELLQTHFKEINPAPIMIDDGSYAFNIIGIGCKDSHITLWIADSHIKGGANRNPSENTPHGLYTITLNENGEQVSCSLNDVDQHQKSQLTDGQISKVFHFKEKAWMVLVPKFHSTLTE